MKPTRAEEDALVARAKEDAEAFGRLYDLYFTSIYRFVYSRVRNQDLAEDLTSDVFFKALRAIGRYKPSGSPFGAWLYQIATNAIADHYRARRPAESIDTALDVAAGGRGVEEQAGQRLEAQRIWAAIDTLPEQQRMALTLKLGEDLKLLQIAEIMGKSEGAVKLLIHRGMAGVRERLDLSTGRAEDAI